MTSSDLTPHLAQGTWQSGPEVLPPVPALDRVLVPALAACPDAPALVVRSSDGTREQWTYAELDRVVQRAADVLLTQGVAPGDHVLLVTSRVSGLIPAVLALLDVGAAFVPVDPGAPLEHWRALAEATGATALVGPAGALTHPAGTDSPLRRIALEELADLPVARPRRGEAQVRPDATAYVLFTSGSTGTPKGVVVSHDNVVHRVPAYLPLLDGSARYLLHSSLSFDGAIGGMFATLLSGGCLVLVPDDVAVDPATAARVVREEAVTHLEPVPSWYAALLDLAGPADLASVRVVVLGGEVLPPELVLRSRAALPAAQLVNDYGPTEVTVAATSHVVADEDAFTDVPIGRPHPNTSVAVLREDGSPAEVGEVGELWVGGPCVARGYLGRPGDPSFDERDGRRTFRTGDLVRWDEHGRLHFCGRRDRQVKIRGQRVEPEGVEAVLAGLPGITGAAVVVEGSGATARLVAHVAAGEATLTPAEVRARLAARLPRHLVPSVVLHGALPLTPGGKVDRTALPGSDEGAEPVGAPPRDALEQAVADAFTAVLGMSTHRETDFYAAGGQSLDAARVVAHVRASTGRELALADLAAATTPAALAAALRDRLPADLAPTLVRRPRPVGQVWRLPASPRQDGFWLQEQVPAGRGGSNLVEVLRLPPATPDEAVQAALEALLERHASLRTGLEPTGRGLVQVVQPHVEVRLEQLPPAADEAALLAAADALGARPFDLARAPLLRAARVDLPDAVALVLVVHHAVVDGWSLDLLLAELAHVLRTGSTAGLPAPEVEMADVVQAVAERTSADRAAAVEHVTSRLRRSAEVADRLLPHDRPLAGRRDPSPGRLRSTLPATVWDDVARLAGELATTPFTVLAASLGVLLAHAAGEPDVVLTVPVSGRGEPQLERVVGCCMNTQLYRVDVSGTPSFADVVRRVSAEVAAGAGHAWLPFEIPALAVDEATRSRARGVMLNLLEDRPFDDRVRGGRMVRTSRPPALAYDDVDLYLTRTGGAVSVDVTYARARFDEPTVRALTDRWLHLLATAVQRPETPVADLPRTTPDEDERLAQQEGSAGPAPECTVLDALRARTLEDPGALSVVDRGRSLSRQELWDRAGTLAAGLAAAQVRAGDAVVLAVDGTADTVALLVACWLVGAVPVPVGARQPEARVRAVAASARSVLVVDDAALATLGDAQDAAPTSPEHVAPAYVLFTSGSTGRPKGVVVSHDALAASTLARLEAYPQRPRVALVAHDLAFDAGLGILAWYLWTGGAVVMARHEDRVDPAALGALLRQHRVGQLDIVPSHYGLLLDLVDPDALAHLELVTLGGEPCPPSLVALHAARLPGAALVNEYGPTECTVWSVAHVCRPTDAELVRVPIGRPVRGAVARVAHPDGRRAAPGSPGELWLGGHLLAEGYLHDAELTAARFVEHDGQRWYRTGDAVRRTPEGLLEFLGRTDEQLKLRGFRIEPGDVEAALLQVPGVARAAVGTAPTARAGEQLVAWVQPDPAAQGTSEVTPSRLRDHLLTVLPEWMVPAAVLVVADMPLTTAGKVDRRRLPQPDARPLDAAPDPTPGPGPVPSPNGLVRTVLASMGELLRDPELGADDDFFERGGDSLLAARLVGQLNAVLGRTVPLHELAGRSTSRGIAAWLDADFSRTTAQSHDAARLVPVRTSGTCAPVVLVARDGSTSLVLQHFLSRHDPDRPVYVLLRPMPPVGHRVPDLAADAKAMVEQLDETLGAGPVHLIGHSASGLVVLEMARRLGPRRGATVLLDTAIPSSWSATPLRPMADAARTARGRWRLRRAGVQRPLPSGESSPASTRAFRLYQDSMGSARLRLSPLTFPVTVLASQRSRDELGEDLGWHRWAPQAEVVPVAGDHLSLLLQPAVHHTVEVVTAVLRSAE